jgi:flagellar biosynthetic protein FliR
MFSVNVKAVSGLFVLGFSLAAPVIFCILLVEIALGVISRNLPQMNMFVMGMPLKAAIGLGALAFWQSGIGAVMTKVYGSIYSVWADLFNSASLGIGTYG